MAHSVRKTATPAEVDLVQLKNCLVNLPQSLVSILENANTPVQNIVIELQYNDNISTAPIGKDGKTSQRRSIFVGWTGAQSKRQAHPIVGKGKGIGSAGRDSEAVVVEIDATFGRTLGLTEGQKLGLVLHPDPPLAHTINIEPLTPADWEIIELHANFLELNLLSQIRAIPNPAFSTLPSVQLQQLHPLTLHLSPTSTANILVSSLVPPLPSTVPFAKIAPDAEVIVAPKLRPRLTDRTASRSIASTGKTSAGGRSLRSAAQQHNQKEQAAKQPLLLRPCTRSFCDPFFDYEDPQDCDAGLRVWVDPDQLVEKLWRGTTYVCVSVVRPPLLETPLDPQQQQRKKDLENSKSGSPASKVVAKLCLWSDVPRSSDVALSSLLCSVLAIDGVVGGLVRIEPAPPQIKNIVRRLKFYPFTSSSSDAIKFGGDRQKRRDSVAEDIEKAYARPYSETDRFLDGPLTDGLLLPPVQNPESALSWDGGLLRFDFQTPTREKLDASRVCWSLGSNLEIEVQEEVHNPVKAFESSNLDADPLPVIEPTMIGIDDLTKQLFSHISHYSSVLLSGGPGSGKSTLACLLGCRLRSTSLYHTQIFSCRKLTGSETRVPTIKETLTRMFMRASWGARLGARSMIILDDLDRLCPAETELQTSDNGRSRQISELICSLSRQHCRHGSGMVLLVTAQNKEAVNSVLIEGNIIREIVTLKVPDKIGRKKLLEYFLGQRLDSISNSNDFNGCVEDANEDEAAWMDGSLPTSPLTDSLTTKTSPFTFVDLLDISSRTDGYMPADLALLVSRAHSESLIRNLHSPSSTSNLSISSQDFSLALKDFTPASLRNVPLQSSTTTFASIGGLRSVRTLLLETLQYPTLYAPIFAQCPLRLRSGLLLYGYPGCGKTLLASAVAGECGLNFISVKGPEILNKYIGASEKSVRDLFERAEAARPCVLFFDEFDSIAPKRGHDSTGVTDRVVNQMLTQMDGAEGLSGVYMLAATSRPDLIDPALLRPGRLDKSILCDLPNFDDRLDILQALSKKLRISDDVLKKGLQEVARRTEGYSGADLQALIYNAHLEAIHYVLGDTSGRGEFGVQKKGSDQGERYGRQNKRSDIMRFRFSPEADEETTTLTMSHAKEVAEYNALLARFGTLRKAKQKERQLRRSEIDEDDTQEERDKKGNNESREPVIQWEHIEASLATTRKSISEAERSRLQTVYREFLVGRNGQMPDGQGSTEIGGRSSLM